MLLDSKFDRILDGILAYDRTIELNLNRLLADFMSLFSRDLPDQLDLVTQQVSGRINTLTTLVHTLQDHQMTMLKSENSGAIIVRRLPYIQDRIDHLNRLKSGWKDIEGDVTRKYVDQYVLKVI